MKLPKDTACQSAVSRGNLKRLTVMEEVLMDGFSDRGSIPLISIFFQDIKKAWKLGKTLKYQRFGVF